MATITQGKSLHNLSLNFSSANFSAEMWHNPQWSTLQNTYRESWGFFITMLLHKPIMSTAIIIDAVMIQISLLLTLI